MSAATEATPHPQNKALARRIGLFDATMVVMGGIIGAGIFMNPYVVAGQVHTPVLILGAWIAGGLIALAGGFIWAELAALRPDVGGQYAYLRDAFHPMLGFLYGWVLLLVIQTGGMAVVAVTFARYFIELTGWRLPDAAVAVVALVLLTIINCAGIRPGAKVQSALTVLKIAAIAMLVAAGAWWVAKPHAVLGVLTAGPAYSHGRDSLSSFLAAMVPVLFAFGGWQTVNFIAGEVRDPRRNLPRALLYGVPGVVALYFAVNFVCVYVLGAQGLAATTTPASAVMRVAWGGTGARILALGIAVSTLGFLSQSILTAPRVYFAMAEDGVFFRTVAHVNPRTHVPDIAIILQSVWTMVIALSGRYEQILNYVTSMDWVFFGLTALTVFVFRKRSVPSHEFQASSTGPNLTMSRRGRSKQQRDGTQPRAHVGVELNDGSDARHYTSKHEAQNTEREALFRTPGHPFTTILFAIAAFAVVINTVYRYPGNTLIGFAILLAGVPVYHLWHRKKSVSLRTK